MRSTFKPVLALLITAVFAASALPASAAPSADLWRKWTAQPQGSTKTVDPSARDQVLQKYVTVGADGVNRVAYGRVTPADRQALNAYVAALAGTTVRELDRAEQLPYWINFYNALTVKVILDNYPVRSIRDIDISPGLFADGPWGKELVTVEGQKVSLDDIEHRILRPIWRDPRIHYAVNCASIGCPNLQTKAFTRGNAEALLEAGAREYINHPRGVSTNGSSATVSSIYVWFKEDFGSSDAAILAHLARHAEPALAAKLAGVTKLDDHAYDWTLNDAGAPGG